MDSIQINTGEKRIAINSDPDRIIAFNPADVSFAERFYDLIKEFEGKLDEYQKRSEEIEANQEVDDNGIPVNLEARISFLREACTYIRGRIDHLFGQGTSQKAFGDTLTLDMFTQFFEGITPFIQSVRSEKVARYTAPSGKKSGRVMK
jgi:hypothetical protein